LHLNVEGWPFDVWPVHQTWALRQYPNQFQSIRDLPRTTFFNVEAVVVSLGPSGARGRTIYSCGFFDALRTRILELNFKENPFPALCIIRSLHLSRKLQFAIGPRLAQYLAENADHVSLSEVMEAQHSHYGRLRFSRDEVHRWWEYVICEHTKAPHRPIRLPVTTESQLMLWDRLATMSALPGND
jgi:hypothetical protein